MSPIADQARGVFHPLHAFLLATTVAPFLGAALCDYAYTSTYHVQWINFSSWLIVGGLAFGGAALACAVFGLRRVERRGGRYLVSLLLLLTAWVLGFINALIHARDAWASMPAGLILSLVVAVLATVAAAIAFSNLHPRGTT